MNSRWRARCDKRFIGFEIWGGRRRDGTRFTIGGCWEQGIKTSQISSSRSATNSVKHFRVISLEAVRS
jgi:hypothetical protein